MDFLEPLHLFILIGAVQGLLISLVILFRRAKAVRSNRLIGLALLILSLRLLFYPFRQVSEAAFWEQLWSASLLSLLLVGPLIFLFITSSVSGGNPTFSRQALHAVPFFYYWTHLFIYPVPIPVCYCFIPLYSGIFYGILSSWTIVKNRSHPQGRFLGTLALLLLFMPLSVIGFSHINSSTESFFLPPATFPYILLTLGFYHMGFYSMKRSNSYFNDLLRSPAKTISNGDYFGLPQLVNLMESEQLFLDAGLTLQKLSQLSNFNRHEISDLINNGLGVSFVEWVNRYRVEAVKEKLRDPKYDHLSIEGIARESGFRSKSTFNKYFKKWTGMTPGAYKKEHS